MRGRAQRHKTHSERVYSSQSAAAPASESGQQWLVTAASDRDSGQRQRTSRDYPPCWEPVSRPLGTGWSLASAPNSCRASVEFHRTASPALVVRELALAIGAVVVCGWRS